MQFLTSTVIAIALAAGIPSALGKPFENLIKRDTVHSKTTSYTNIIYGKFDYPAYNTACLGNCCVYFATSQNDDATIGGATIDSIQIRNRAAALLGCGATDVNKVNALGVASDGSGVCISNGNGCSDCFDDSDFTPA